jgi:hypothetical protein
MKLAPENADYVGRLGVLPGLPFITYLDLPDAHSTALKNILISPKACKWWRENRRDNDTLRQGRAFHTAVLEPDRFYLDFACWYGGDRKGRKWDEFCLAHAEQTIITAKQYDAACRMRDAIFEDDVAGPLMRAKGRSELTVRFKHEATGVMCKVRLDRLTTSPTLIDLKSTVNVSEAPFTNISGRYEYALQLALYRAAVVSALGIAPPTKIIAVQKEAPWDVVVYDLPESTLVIGMERAERALRLFAECNASGKWPGVAGGKELSLGVPAWLVGAPQDASHLTMNGLPLFENEEMSL